jgi:phosphoribosylanthranilate isomerase
MSIRVKICGITTARDAEMAIEAGADLIGLNFVPSSKRYVRAELARPIVEAIAGRVEVVGVVANLSLAALEELRAATAVDSLQLHGDELPELLRGLPSCDFKAVRIADERDVDAASGFRGPRLLVDAKVGDALGGTGRTFDWSLIGDLARERELLLAGGLNPENVAQAVAQVAPWGVDVASGVEIAPGRKDAQRVRDFVLRAKSANGQ